MIILGIETSCDETALALIETREASKVTKAGGSRLEYRVIQSLVHSQADLHSAYGGVFPTLAKREHSKNLVPLLDKILQDLPPRDKKHPGLSQALISIKERYVEQNSDLLESLAHARFLEDVPRIDRIAVTEGPGLEPALWVGITFARILGELWGIPVIPIDHMEGHVAGSLLDDDTPSQAWQELKEAPLPAVALLISGGHTELVRVDEGFRYSILGATRDDAVGEAFDKAARLLGLPYPGGPHISRLAHEAQELGIEAREKLPRPMIGSASLDFSFSGLKTAVLYMIQKAQKDGAFDERFKKGLAREFEQAVSDVLASKLSHAIESVGARSVIVGGGVSANRSLREAFKGIAARYDIPLLLPSPHISGDNALMIALVAAMRIENGSDGIAAPREIRARGTKKITDAVI